MPAYFSLTLEFSRYEVDFDTVKKTEEFFEKSGLKFKSGYWGKAEDRSRYEIILHNQTLLEDDFMLGAEQHHDEGYWQNEYEYGGFSSVRGMIMNNYPVDNEFEYVLLIDEEEMVDYTDDGIVYKAEAVEKVKTLAKKLWEMPQVRSIQTGLEYIDSITPESEYREGKPMQAHPFAIISERYLPSHDASLYDIEHINFGGALITPKKLKIK